MGAQGIGTYDRGGIMGGVLKFSLQSHSRGAAGERRYF